MATKKRTRPRSPDDRNIHIRIPAELYSSARILAVRAECDVRDVVSAALRLLFNENEEVKYYESDAYTVITYVIEHGEAAK